jgi:type III secretory pathway component EscV
MFSFELSQVASILSVALVADSGGVATDYNKLAVVYGTLIGFIMISVITIVGSVIDNGLHRSLVSDPYCCRCDNCPGPSLAF